MLDALQILRIGRINSKDQEAGKWLGRDPNHQGPQPTKTPRFYFDCMNFVVTKECAQPALGSPRVSGPARWRNLTSSAQAAPKKMPPFGWWSAIGKWRLPL